MVIYEDIWFCNQWAPWFNTHVCKNVCPVWSKKIISRFEMIRTKNIIKRFLRKRTFFLWKRWPSEENALINISEKPIVMRLNLLEIQWFNRISCSLSGKSRFQPAPSCPWQELSNLCHLDEQNFKIFGTKLQNFLISTRFQAAQLLNFESG